MKKNDIIYLHSCGLKNIFSSYNNGRDMNFYDYCKYFNDVYNIKSYLVVNGENITLPLVYINHIRNINIKELVNIINYKNINDIVKNKIVVCDFVTFIECFVHFNEINRIENISKVLIMDTLELTLFERKEEKCKCSRIQDKEVISKINELLTNNKDKIVFLITPFNKDLKENFACITYYKRINYKNFNENYIKSIKRNKKDIFYINNKDKQYMPVILQQIKNTTSYSKNFNITYVFEDIFNYECYIYYRKPCVLFIEQMGRIIFEMLYFKYNVIFTDKNLEKTGKDFYLEYFKNTSSNIYDHDFLETIEQCS